MASFKKIHKKRDYKKKQNKVTYGLDGRLFFLSAIVFVLLSLMIFSLYRIQIVNHDHYLAKASRQHLINSKLKSKRGEIWLNQNNSSSYINIATNKDFSSIYLVPRIMKEENIKMVLWALIDVFYYEEIVEEVDKYLEDLDEKELKDEIAYINSLNIDSSLKQSKIIETETRRANLKYNQEWMEFREMQRQLEIDERKQTLFSSYLNRVSSFNSYAFPLKRKVENEDLMEFYYLILKDQMQIENKDDLFLDRSSVSLKIDDASVDISNSFHGIYYEWESLRFYPEKEIFAHLSGFVNLDGEGNYGLESFFNEELSGVDGMIVGERGSYKGKKIIIDKQEYQAPVDGNNLLLTIDYAVQTYVCTKLQEFSERYLFDSASISIMDPQSGRIIALCVWPSFDPNNYQDISDPKIFDNQVISYQYEPGSVFKTITLAMAIDQKKVNPATTYVDQGQLMIDGWHKPIRNSDYSQKGAHGLVDMDYVLSNSLNTGAIYAAQQVGKGLFSEYLYNFGFGERMGIELGAESPGNIDNLMLDNIKEIDFATASFGQGIAVTPLQMLSSYAAIANKGVLMKPYLVDSIYDENGELIKKVEDRLIRRVISEEAAQATSAMLVNVIDNGHATGAKVDGYYLGGKTGTAQIPSPQGGYLSDQYIHNFVGYGPIDDPKFVVLIKFDNPKNVKFAAGSASPAFGEIADFLLRYYQVPRNR